MSPLPSPSIRERVHVPSHPVTEHLHDLETQVLEDPPQRPTTLSLQLPPHEPFNLEEPITPPQPCSTVSIRQRLFSSDEGTASMSPISSPSSSTTADLTPVISYDFNLASTSDHQGSHPKCTKAFKLVHHCSANCCELTSKNTLWNMTSPKVPMDTGKHSLEATRLSSSPVKSPPRKLLRLDASAEEERVYSMPVTPKIRSPARGSSRLKRYTPPMVAFHLPKCKDWQKIIVQCARDAMVTLVANELLPKGVHNALFTEQAIEVVDYAQKFEEFVFRCSDSHESYSTKIIQKVTSWLEKRAANVSPRRRQTLTKSVKVAPRLVPKVLVSKSATPSPEEALASLETPRLETPQSPKPETSQKFTRSQTPSFFKCKQPWESTIQTETVNDSTDFVKNVFLSLWKKMNDHTPESISLRRPISNADGAFPKKQMTLRTIKLDLESNRYSDPWVFIENVWVMFNNGLQAKEKLSKVYQDCITIIDLFQQNIEPKMIAMGYCCGVNRQFGPKQLPCASKDDCVISIDEEYFHYKNLVAFCETCYVTLPKQVNIDEYLEEDKDAIAKEQKKSNIVKKTVFSHVKNNFGKMEPFVTCSMCERRLHQGCVHYLEPLPFVKFVCNRCLQMDNKEPITKKPRARNLPVTHLSSSIEQRVNNYLKDNGVDITVRIRLVSSVKKDVPVEPLMLNRYKDTFPESFPCVTKTMLAFIENDNDDICFFGLHVQEYGSDCPAPNTGRVYIACLDSVHYFTPKEHRTPVYHEIILGYLDFAKNLGFSVAHIWICPAKPGASDFIFYCHPPEQKMPGIERLQGWYETLLEKGIEVGIVTDFQDIERYAIDVNISSPIELPYFQGDYWHDTLEILLKVSRKKGRTSSKSRGKAKTKTGVTEEALWRQVMEKMARNKALFIVARLDSESNKVIQDPDGFISCGMMKSRDDFVNKCAENQWEFSTLHRVSYSTLCVVAEILGELTAICDHCDQQVFTWYNCATCKKGEIHFDLCSECQSANLHKHPMKKVVNGVVVD